MTIICFLVALLACLIGKICGMGGGVIIKPVLDALGIMSVAEINFLSGCTVIGMSAWSVGKSFAKNERDIDLKVSTPLGIGAAIGGIAGKELFNRLARLLPDANHAGGIQAALLLTATVLALIYTIKKAKIKSYTVTNKAACVLIGLLLGCLGAFLGIGGGPFNMAVLFLFFTMTTKMATQNSLYIILISQIAGMLKTIISREIPPVPIEILVGMILCGILGSEIGGHIHKRLDEQQNTLLFELSMIFVILIAAYNLRLLIK